MGCFLNLPLEDQQAHVARMLDLSPTDKSSWPMTIIDAVISGAEQAAELDMRNRVQRLMRKN